MVEAVHLDELESFPVDEEGLTWRPIRRRFDIQAFGTNAYTAESAGQRVVEEHKEGSGHQELYVVVRGRATFTLDAEEIDAPAGTFVFIRDSQVQRGAIAAEDNTAVLAVGAKPGVVFEPSAWETVFAAYGYRRRGDPQRGRAVLQEAVDRHPDAWQGLYHLSCFAALDGDRERALDLIQQAAAQDPEAARRAAEDPDFDTIKDDPRFPR